MKIMKMKKNQLLKILKNKKKYKKIILNNNDYK